ncbi:hypothetical protein QO034_02730 [Sedimentitalea sp. JM2-8]|uniref:Uncharacterized protein n=1 Tax=Sedimentitalea xiamensis TaxID=3050037 RepID=A0ABT7FA77_9RHOB|nr:hypothetical protein [Sedimentitalea xiamensis]MDK3072012.1 hypothetical protein [Sedimentitalea xiamensis]
MKPLFTAFFTTISLSWISRPSSYAPVGRENFNGLSGSLLS